jgi:hypothetical protein
MPSRRASEQNDRRFAVDTMRQQRAKIGICRDKNSILRLGGRNNRFVICGLKS